LLTFREEADKRILYKRAIGDVKMESQKKEMAKCIQCGKILTHYRENVRCRECWLKNPTPSKLKGTHIQTNTGKTHFKKGATPWNKGITYTAEFKAEIDETRKSLKGKPMPKPDGFSKTMRKVNPPLGRKIKFSGRKTRKKIREWRKGYVWLYKPDHPTSRKKAPDYGYVLEHRMLMELHLKRSLTALEVIHHIDGDKTNNKIENLICCKNSKEHGQIHIEMELFIEKLIREGKVFYDRKEKEFRFR